MDKKELEQKIKDYFNANKNKPTVWDKVCHDLKIAVDQKDELLNYLSENRFIETQVISLGRIIVSLSPYCLGMVESTDSANQGFNGSTNGYNFIGNTIIVGDNNETKSVSKNSNYHKQGISVNPDNHKKKSFFQYVIKYWWLLFISIIAGIVILFIENNYFQK